MSKTSISPNLRQEVAANSWYRCCYCLSQEDVTGIRFTVDHIIPESLGGTTAIGNLCLACWDCNLFKQNHIAATDPKTGIQVPLFHPKQQKWQDHFFWEENGLLVSGNTPSGRATVLRLRLNRPVLLRARERWIRVGWHPPKE